MTATTTGGTIHGQQLSLAAGETITLASDLTVISEQDLHIDGAITPPAGTNAPAISITLISLNGNVYVGAAGRIGLSTGSSARDGASDTDLSLVWSQSYGDAATNGGYVKISAPKGSIKIDGEVYAQHGGFGGSGNATCLFGPAVAVGGEGGYGGDVLLCALESIGIGGNAKVIAGGSCWGGSATANGGEGDIADAEGAPSNDGGNVRFIGKGTTQVYLQGGTIAGGWVMLAGAGIAVGSTSGGGDALAAGGRGGNGGSVTFTDCFVMQNAGQVLCKYGGDGGLAQATGGTGSSAYALWGDPGGPATAAAGDGGKPGPIPQLPLSKHTFAKGTIDNSSGFSGKGGNATATGGPGGAGKAFKGGSSGPATASGGTSGRTGATATPPTATSGPVGPTGTVGGIGAPATSTGGW